MDYFSNFSKNLMSSFVKKKDELIRDSLIENNIDPDDVNQIKNRLSVIRCSNGDELIYIDEKTGKEKLILTIYNSIIKWDGNKVTVTSKFLKNK